MYILSSFQIADETNKAPEGYKVPFFYREELRTSDRELAFGKWDRLADRFQLCDLAEYDENGVLQQVYGHIGGHYVPEILA